MKGPDEKCQFPGANEFRQNLLDGPLGDSPLPWRAAAHPLACVREALDGETDPRMLGVAPGPHYDQLEALR